MILAHEYQRLCLTPSDINEHLPKFVAMVEALDASHVIELGTRTGVSTVAWLHALEGRGHLTSVDIDPAPPIGEHKHWTFIQGDDLDPYVIARLESAAIVFIVTPAPSVWFHRIPQSSNEPARRSVPLSAPA